MSSDICWLGNKVFSYQPINQGTGINDPINSNAITSNTVSSNAMETASKQKTASAPTAPAITPSTVYPIKMGQSTAMVPSTTSLSTPTVTSQGTYPATSTMTPSLAQVVPIQGQSQTTQEQPADIATMLQQMQQSGQPIDPSLLAQYLSLFQQGPPLSTDVGYIPYYLTENIGKNVRAEFILGSSQYSDKVGRLIEVGINYFVLDDVNSRTHVMCDLYSVKFVTVLQE